MTELTAPANDDPSTRAAAIAARAIIGEPAVVAFRPLFEDRHEEAEFLGEQLDTDIRSMMKRYPVTHAPNLAGALNSVRPNEEPASPEDLREWRVRLTHEEILRLGEQRLSDPILSVARVQREELTDVTEAEPGRRTLTDWLVRKPDDPLLGSINVIEFRLFNSGSDLAVGECAADESDELPTRWVMRPRRYSDEGFGRLQERLETLSGLVPETHLVRDGEETMTLARWEQAEPASKQECERFIELARARGIDSDDFDIHADNILRRPNGSLVYVDEDYLELSHFSLPVKAEPEQLP